MLLGELFWCWFCLFCLGGLGWLFECVYCGFIVVCVLGGGFDCWASDCWAVFRWLGLVVLLVGLIWLLVWVF